MRAIFDNFRLALGTFGSNPLRSMLTLLGIVIGVATVVAMMGVIEGLKIKVSNDMAILGSNVFVLARRPSGIFNFDVEWKKFAKRPDMNLEEVRAIQENAPSTAAVSAALYKGGQKVASARAETRPNVWMIGGTAPWLDTQGVALATGRFFGEFDDLEARDVVVLAPDVVDVCFGKEEPLGKEVRILGHPFQVIGVLKRRGSFMGIESMDNQVVLPMGSFRRLFGGVKNMEIQVKAADSQVFSKAQDEAIAAVRRRRGLAPDQENNFELTTNDADMKMFNDMSNVIGAAGIGICLLSLVVGGIGILNIMLVSVTERTREIGIRKALGARKRRILAQFATEAVVLSLVGGLIGIVVGYGVAGLARWVIGLPTSVPAWAVLVAVTMSSVVGLVFGIYPAARAAQLDPVEAMRNE